MKFTKKPVGLSASQSVIFYASKMRYFELKFNDPDLMGEPCSLVHYFFVEGERFKSDDIKTCNSRIYDGQNVIRCEGCQSNSEGYKEKRKLKQAFGVAQKQLLKFTLQVEETGNFLFQKEEVK